MEDRGPAAYVAEFVGTLLLVFFICAAFSLYGPEPSPVNPNPFVDFGVIGLVHVLVLFVLFQTLAVVSGAHFNPAVTVALTALRQIKIPDAAIYIVAQLAGAVAGALLTKAILLDEGQAENYGAPAVTNVVNGAVFPAMVVEALGTFFLLWAFIGVAVHPQAAKDWAGFAIGGALGTGVMVLAPITGGAFNPARSFGPMLVSGAWDDFFVVYLVGPLIGALVAALAYFYMFVQPGRKGEPGVTPVG